MAGGFGACSYVYIYIYTLYIYIYIYIYIYFCIYIYIDTCMCVCVYTYCIAVLEFCICTPLSPAEPGYGFQQARFELLREEHVRRAYGHPGGFGGFPKFKVLGLAFGVKGWGLGFGVKGLKFRV